MNSVFRKPSIYPHIFGGGLILVAFLVVAINITSIIKLEPYKLLVLILLLSIATGIHGISHIGMEVFYKYNPWKGVLDETESK